MNTKLATRQIRLNEWAVIIKDCKASGQKVDIYCEQHGLSRDAYYYWLRKVKEAALTQAGFVELPALTSVPDELLFLHILHRHLLLRSYREIPCGNILPASFLCFFLYTSLPYAHLRSAG